MFDGVRHPSVLIVAASLAWGGAALIAGQDIAVPTPAASSLVDTYCITCHNDKLKTAGLTLQNLDLSTVPEHAAVWEKVARKLRSGEMPPQTVRVRPKPEDASALVSYLETTLDHAAIAHPNPGRAPVHRLNRAEYSNAIRDPLGVDIRAGEWLPVDDS